MHTRHLSYVVLVDIFWKIEEVCCWLGQRELVCFEWAVMELRFFPPYIRVQWFSLEPLYVEWWFLFTISCFLFIFQFIVFLFIYFFPLAQIGVGGHGPLAPPSTGPLKLAEAASFSIQLFSQITLTGCLFLFNSSFPLIFQTAVLSHQVRKKKTYSL